MILHNLMSRDFFIVCYSGSTSGHRYSLNLIVSIQLYFSLKCFAHLFISRQQSQNLNSFLNNNKKLVFLHTYAACSVLSSDISIMNPSTIFLGGWDPAPAFIGIWNQRDIFYDDLHIRKTCIESSAEAHYMIQYSTVQHSFTESVLLSFLPYSFSNAVQV